MIQNFLICLGILSWKIVFVSRKKLEKIFGWWEMFKILHFSKGGPFDSEWLDLPRNTVIKNTVFFSKKTWKKILGDEKCSKFFIFQWGVHLTQNSLICLETLSWKIRFFFFKKKNLKKFWVMRIVQYFTFFKEGSNPLRMI